MDLTEEWKSQFPIGKDFNAPLLLSGQASRAILGPLFFIPKPNCPTQLLFLSPSLFPPLLPPLPRLSLPRFLSVSSPDSPIPLSTSSSIASVFGPQHPDQAAYVLSHNLLQFLIWPGKDAVLLFFPTGSNHDQVGFLVLSVEDSNLNVRVADNGDILVAKERFNYRIVRLLVNQVDDFGGVSGNSLVTVGYVMAYTTYSVHWYGVKSSEQSQRPVLNYLGCKLFKTCSIVSACWSPHLPQESLVLLESGELFLFDLGQKSNAYFKGVRLKVSWNDFSTWGNCKWVACEFSWHPRILIVARSDAVFLVDLRFDECSVTVLANIETLSIYAPVGKEQFLTFSKAGSDGFQYVLASQSLLFLCDVRRPLTPLVQWVHGIDQPCYIYVYRLSELRSQSWVDTHDWATESGSCILLGSFWSSYFSLFCYGPSLPSGRDSVSSQNSTTCMSLHAWELPFHFSLSGHECHCGNCILREEFLKDALPDWVDWQQKKELVLGFGILSKDLSGLLPESDEFGGFTLIRLMSSGKLEAQRFSASWDMVKELETAHGDSSLHFEDTLLHSMTDEEYKFPKRFKYLKLQHLYAYLNGNIAEVLDSKLKKHFQVLQEKKSFSLNVHEILCEKLKVFGLDRSQSSIVAGFSDVSLPTSIFEIALRQTWAGLPIELLPLAFSNYSELLEVLLDKKKISLEFLVVPDLHQLPPFFLRKPSSRSNKWSQKVQRSGTLVGPVLPLPVLLTLNEFCNGCPNSQDEVGSFSAEMELSKRCNEVLQEARDMAILDYDSKLHVDQAISLTDDREQTWVDSQKPKSFFSYRPVAGECFTAGDMQNNCFYKDERFATLVSKVDCKDSALGDKMNKAEIEVFDDLCPIKLKFDAPVVNFGSQEAKTYDAFKRHFSLWQERFSPYNEFCALYKFQK